MGCFDHNQEYIGTCMWCGKQLCSRCVARASGKKLYCRNCASNLGGVEIRHEQQDEPVKEQKFVQQPQAKPQPMQLKSQVSEAKKIQSQQTKTLSSAQAAPQQKTAPVSSPAASSAAKSALGLFAQQAMEQLEAEKKKKEVK